MRYAGKTGLSVACAWLITVTRTGADDEIAGIPPTRAVGKGWIDAVHPDDRDHVVTQWYGGLGQETLPSGLFSVELENYVAVDGILMPRRVTREPQMETSADEVTRRDTEWAKYRFNVTYNPAIFDHPIPKKVKPDDWKPQKDS